MTTASFTGSFTQQEPLPEASIQAAVDVMQSGRLHRYNVAEGETPVVSQLEEAFAKWQGASFCLALASGGQAIQISLRAAGVQPGDQVLTNAFTLAPVPGSIEAVKGRPLLVECDDQLRIDIDDLQIKAQQSGAKWLLLSHMRGHVCDMDRLMSVANAEGLTVIEDCAHTMGAKWNDIRSGNHGLAGCFSTQTYKHMNSGEGGLLTSNDPEFMARATIFSGSYMLYERHGASPAPEYFDAVRLETPNLSARMDNLRAAILIPQIHNLENNIRRWNERYLTVAQELRQSNCINVPDRPAGEAMVGSSIQFRIPGLGKAACGHFVKRCAERGVELKWFGGAKPVGFTSAHTSWRYIEPQTLPKTDKVLSTLFDMRLPLTFSVEDCELIGNIIRETAVEISPA